MHIGLRYDAFQENERPRLSEEAPVVHQLQLHAIRQTISGKFDGCLDIAFSKGLLGSPHPLARLKFCSMASVKRAAVIERRCLIVGQLPRRLLSPLRGQVDRRGTPLASRKTKRHSNQEVGSMEEEFRAHRTNE
jgi:hypothetical protein